MATNMKARNGKQRLPPEGLSPVVTLARENIPDGDRVVCGGGAELGPVTGPGHAAHRVHMC
jgi:hypothetical protein